MHEPDPAIVAAARNGQEAAFVALVRGFQADVWRFCLGMLRDEARAEDVTQEVFTKLFRHLHRYKGDSKFTTWLFSITRNCVLDEIRRSARRDRIAESVQNQPTQAIADGTRAIEVREAIGELPVDLREPLLMVDMFGMTYLDVSKLLAIPLGTVKSRVHHARSVLARSLLQDTEAAADDA